jgi:hypothetical protein
MDDNNIVEDEEDENEEEEEEEDAEDNNSRDTSEHANEMEGQASIRNDTISTVGEATSIHHNEI